MPGEGEYARLKDDAYLDLLAALAPVHDVGLLDVPRAVLMKPDRLDRDEASVVQTHATHGASCSPQSPAGSARTSPGWGWRSNWCGATTSAGTGADTRTYCPAGRSRCRHASSPWRRCTKRCARRPYRPALSHVRAVKIITTESPGQFDPVLLAAFGAITPQLELIYQGK